MKLFATALFAPVVLTGSSLGQTPCSSVSPGFGAPGTKDSVFASAIFDDGTGPDLYVGGSFDSAGGEFMGLVARWDGTGWSGLGSGLVGSNVSALVVHDDGSGPALYAGGDFHTAGGQPAADIARWDGTSWSQVGGGLGTGGIKSLAVAPTANGPRLFAAKGKATMNEWDGTAWISRGLFTAHSNQFGDVDVLAAFQGVLYVGGRFDYVDGQPADSLVIWDGSWSMPSEALSYSFGDEEVLALGEFDDGNGPALYAAGRFNMAGAASVTNFARWDGDSWSEVGGGLQFYSYGTIDLATHDDGTGSKLYLLGYMSSVGGNPAKGIAAWGGTSWTTPGGGLAEFGGSVGWARTACTYDDGTGARLFVGGEFDLAGEVSAFHAALWDGDWTPLGVSEEWMDDTVKALTVFDDGSGERLYAGGDFYNVAGASTRTIAAWNGSAWSGVGGGLWQGQAAGHVNALATFDDGSGPGLYAGGFFNTTGNGVANNLARWGGTSWQNVGLGVTHGGFGQSQIYDFEVFDGGAGEGLYVTGNFKRAGGNTGFLHVARWDGAVWSPLGAGLDKQAHALAAHDDGSGPALYVGGRFNTAGAVAASRIARWDGTQWSDVGGGVTGAGDVNGIASFDDGSGAALYAAGNFDFIGGIAATKVARWDGTGWSAVGAGLAGEVYTLEVVQHGLEPVELHAGGEFPGHVARWDGTSWSSLAGGASHAVRALAAFDDGSGAWPSLFLGGDFTGVDGIPSARLARYSRDCGCPAESYCTAGTSASGCQALINASGVASASASSGFTLTANSVEGTKPGLFFYGANGRKASSWGNGTSYVCVVPPRLRGGILNAGGTAGSCDGVISQDLNARWCPTCPKPSHNPGPGALMQAQLWYRDPANTSNRRSGMSDAVEFTVCP